MKKMILIAMTSLLASSSFAAMVHSAKLDSSRKNILIEVSYSGCNEHKFKLGMGMCLESNPPQCEAQLVDLDDAQVCNAFFSETIAISLKSIGITPAFFDVGATLTIKGSGGTSALVQSK